MPQTAIPRENREALNSMLGRRKRIRHALAAGQPWLALIRSCPELEMTRWYGAGAVGRDEADLQEEPLELLGRYVAAWNRFPICAEYPAFTEMGDRRRVRPEAAQMPMLPLDEPVGKAE